MADDPDMVVWWASPVECGPRENGQALYYESMSPRALQQILRLPVGERIELVQAIWDSVVADSGSVPVMASQRRTLDRRLADLKANPAAERPWSAVRASLKRKK